MSAGCSKKKPFKNREVLLIRVRKNHLDILFVADLDLIISVRVRDIIFILFNRFSLIHQTQGAGKKPVPSCFYQYLSIFARGSSCALIRGCLEESETDRL